MLELKNSKVQIGCDLPTVTYLESGRAGLGVRDARLPALLAQSPSVLTSVGQAGQRGSRYLRSGRSLGCIWDPDLGMLPAGPGLLSLIGGRAGCP